MTKDDHGQRPPQNLDLQLPSELMSTQSELDRIWEFIQQKFVCFRSAWHEFWRDQHLKLGWWRFLSGLGLAFSVLGLLAVGWIYWHTLLLTAIAPNPISLAKPSLTAPDQVINQAAPVISGQTQEKFEANSVISSALATTSTTQPDTQGVSQVGSQSAQVGHGQKFLDKSLVSAEKMSLAIDSSDEILVHITGAVRHPGVYQVSVSSVVQDVVQAAGGVSSQVWQDYLDQYINLAAPVTAHQKIWIPTQAQQNLVLLTPLTADLSQANDSTTQSSGQPNLENENTTQDNNQSSASGKKISVNQASLTELMTLNGIGQKRAEDIIANRPYTNFSELTSKAKIPASTVTGLSANLEI